MARSGITTKVTSPAALQVLASWRSRMEPGHERHESRPTARASRPQPNHNCPRLVSTVTTNRAATGYTIVSYRHCATRATAAWRAWRQRRTGAAALITCGSLPPHLQPSAPCLDCGWLTCRHDQPGEWYMVTDQVWEQAGMTDTRRHWLTEHPEHPPGRPAGRATTCASAAWKTALAVG